MDEDALLEPFDRMLADAASPAAIRAIDAGGNAGACWEAIASSGFLDALVPETAGGAGLTLGQVGPLLRALGGRATPVPVAETMVARALLAEAGQAAPQGSMVLAEARTDAVGGWRTAAVPMATLAAHALVAHEGEARLVALEPGALFPIDVAGSRTAVLRWNAAPSAVATMVLPAGALTATAAALRAAAIAGAGDHLLEMTTAYANERVQFGKPIGRQQAIQQQLAVMAEHTIAARIAAQMATSGGFPVPERVAAIAKIVTGRAAAQLAAIAHAVHGAIGMSAEYDLQLYTRRLHEWRLADGSESFWARRLGAARLASNATSSLAFVS